MDDRFLKCFVQVRFHGGFPHYAWTTKSDHSDFEVEIHGEYVTDITLEENEDIKLKTLLIVIRTSR